MLNKICRVAAILTVVTITIAFVASANSTNAQGAPRDLYWVGGAGSWSDASHHWSTTSGGTSAAGNLPAAGDNVHFDANSGTVVFTVTVDMPNVMINDIDESSIYATIDLGAHGITVNGDITVHKIIKGTAAAKLNGENKKIICTRAGITGYISSPVVLGASRTLDATVSGCGLGLMGVVSGTYGLTKIGPGVATLAAANTFSGGLQVKQGKVANGNGDVTITTCFGAPNSPIILGDTTGNADATLAIQRVNFTNPLIVAAGSHDNTLSIVRGPISFGTFADFKGPITLNNNLTIATPVQKITISGNISGRGNLTLQSIRDFLDIKSASINNVGTITNAGTSDKTTTLSSNIGSNVTSIVQNSPAGSVLDMFNSNPESSSKINIIAGRVIYPNGATPSYTLNTGTPSHGTVAKSPSQATYLAGTSVILTAIPDAGYIFNGWSGDATDTSTSTTIVMNSNKNITANFAAGTSQTYTLNIGSPTNGSVTKSPVKTTYSYNEQVTLTATPAAGYVFLNWSGDATGTTNPLQVTMNGNKNIAANFGRSSFTITVATVLPAGGTVSPGTTTVSRGASQTFTITPNIGYRLLGVNVDGTGMGIINSYTFRDVTADHAIRATFAEGASVVNTINAKASEHGTISPSGAVSINSHANQNFIITPNLGYVVSDLIVDGSSVVISSNNNYAFTNVIKDHTISVTFAPQSYTLNINQPANGAITVSPVLSSYPAGTEVTLTAHPNAGYVWTGWMSGAAFGLIGGAEPWTSEGDLGPIQNPVTFKIQNDKDISAAFTSSTPLAVHTYYMATNGNDNSAGTQSAPWATFASSFKKMRAGDTLIVKDGTYKQSLVNPPSGSPFQYTTVRAEHPFEVILDNSEIPPPTTYSSPLTISGGDPQKAYITIEGFKFIGRGDLVGNIASYPPVAAINMAHHIKVLKCAFFNGPDIKWSATVGVGMIDHRTSFILVEDSYAFGGGRYKFVAQTADHVIFRRCVARMDKHDSEANYRPQGIFASYWSPDTVYENSIAIDSDQVEYYTMNGGVPGLDFSGGFTFAKPGEHRENQSFLGSIALNVAKRGIHYAGGVEGIQHVKDTVIYDVSGGGIAYGQLGGELASVNVEHTTVGKVVNYEDYLQGGMGVGVLSGGFTSAEIKNSLITNAYKGVTDYISSNYNDFFGNAMNYGAYIGGNTAPQPGPRDMYVDPKMKYLTRVEDDSPLKGKASDGGDIGANIIYQYGVSGTLWGEPGFDQLTNKPLWPFPYENEIKKDMAAYQYGSLSGKRGFAADGNGLYGGPITLTSYIWEYLGNPCPSEICVAGATNASPSLSTQSSVYSVTPGSTLTFDITANDWDSATVTLEASNLTVFPGAKFE